MWSIVGVVVVVVFVIAAASEVLTGYARDGNKPGANTWGGVGILVAVVLFFMWVASQM